MCHENPDISPIHKFYYLKGCLKGEAAEVIASLEITSDNYQQAWELLTSRYDRRTRIVDSHVKALHEIQHVSKEFSIQALLDQVQKRIRALRALGQPVDHWDTFLIYIIREKLDKNTRDEWLKTVGKRKNLPTLKDMLSFLDLLAETEPAHPLKETHKGPQYKNNGAHSRFQGRNSQTCLATSHDSISGKFQSSCIVCKEVHPLYACSQFKNLTTQERFDIVKRASICHNCFLSNHKTVDCKRRPCFKCNKRHNSLLHFSTENPITGTSPVQETSTSQLISTLGTYHIRSQDQVFLGTAIVDILDGNGQYRPCRALLDSCSQCNSITEKFANSLNLRRKETNTKLAGVGNIQSKIKHITSTTIKSRYDDIEFNVAFLILPEITGQMPTSEINKNTLRIPDNIFLADPTFHKSSNVDILIGAEYFYHLMRMGQIKVKGQSAIFQETDLGWMFAGRYTSPPGPQVIEKTQYEVTCNLIKFLDLPILWELGEDTASKPRSDEEEAAESYYVKTIKRDESGRYIARLPFNEKRESLGNSRNTAFQRFYALEKRFFKNSDLKSKYSDCIDTYFKEGHIVPVESQDLQRPGYYLPHQAVIKADSLTTKVRVVFDGSAKSSTGISLNDTFLIGPTIQEGLFSILTRFRSFPYAMTADIEQMYRQVRISDEDNVYQKIIWRKEASEPIKIYALKTVTFGTACAPFLAIRTLHKLAEDEREIHWEPKTDSILYTVNLKSSMNECTKRTILSEIAKLFDPLGLLGPVVLVGKIIIQKFWKLKLGWDEPVPAELKDTWVEYKKQLPSLNLIRFPRCVTIEGPSEVQIHGFCDASEKAYGASLYFRTTDSQGMHRSSIICSKSRVAPIKTKSLPKLELCAATLLVQLYKTTVQTLRIEFARTVLWSDSTIVLNWINSPPHTLPTFEANRVADIQSTTQPQDWHHVRTHENPADFISRGQLPQEFINNSLWMHGPQWLCKDDRFWPNFNFRNGTDVNIVQVNLTRKDTEVELPFWTKYSSFKRLQTTVAYCLRFIKNSKNKDKDSRTHGSLSRDELKSAHRAIIRKIQSDAFLNDINALENKRDLDRKSPLLSLTPFLDQGIIKVGGRLNRAALPETQKHPIILPKNHNLTKLIIRDEHIKRLHAGVNATLYGVRETYWPLDGRNITRHMIRQCVTCFRAKPREINYPMGDLPQKRATFDRPFLHVGVDYCGPFFTKEHRRRNRTQIKTYVSVFVCFATKAVHLELANDLTTEAFLACLKRFFARRGQAYSMHSDNGTNFVGASSELKDLYKQLKTIEQNDQVKQYLLKREVSWHFTPPRAPHFGGLWEAGVKSFKHHFTRIAGNSLLTYEQLHTYVVEVEAIFNSCPLTPLSSDPNDLLPLTPGHFLTGSSMTSLPEDDFQNTPNNRLSCWQIAQKMRQHFWERWHKEYLNEMISRCKWTTATNQEDVHIGRLVVVKEDNLPPMNWKLARIIELHPGEDGVSRVATIRTATTTCKRSLKRLYPHPTN